VGVVTLPFDNYYRDHSHLSPEAREFVNYDHPDSLDTELFAKDLQSLINGSAVEAPSYDFSSHCRKSDRIRLDPQPVVLAEGILVLATREVRRCLDITVFLEAPEKLRLERRIARDVAHRGRTPEGVRRQFSMTVSPMYDEYVAPFAGEADLKIRGIGNFASEASTLVDLLVERIH